MKSIYFVTALIVILAMSYSSQCKRKKVKIDENWVMYTFPRTTMPPGYVIRVEDGDNTIHPVTTLKSNKPFDTGYAYMPSSVENRTFNGDIFFKFLFWNQKDTTLSGGGNKKVISKMSIGKGFLESLDELTIDSMIRNSRIQWKSDNRYYIIQSTMSSKELHYSFQKNSGYNANLILNFENAVNLNGHLSKNKNDSTGLDQTFDSYYRVYYTITEINPQGTSISNTKHFTYSKANIQVGD